MPFFLQKKNTNEEQEKQLDKQIEVLEAQRKELGAKYQKEARIKMLQRDISHIKQGERNISPAAKVKGFFSNVSSKIAANAIPSDSSRTAEIKRLREEVQIRSLKAKLEKSRPNPFSGGFGATRNPASAVIEPHFNMWGDPIFPKKTAPAARHKRRSHAKYRYVKVRV